MSKISKSFVFWNFLAVASILSTAAKADCSRDLNGDWVFRQTNNYHALLNLRHTGNEIQGTARYPNKGIYVHGSVDGSLSGNRLKLSVYWESGSIGEYEGTVNAQGRIEGSTHDRMHPANMANWYSDHTAPCQSVPQNPNQSAEDAAKDYQKVLDAQKKKAGGAQTKKEVEPLVPGLKTAPRPGSILTR